MAGFEPFDYTVPLCCCVFLSCILLKFSESPGLVGFAAFNKFVKSLGIDFTNAHLSLFFRDSGYMCTRLLDTIPQLTEAV